MEEKVGAYRIDEDGHIVLDEKDNAMATRFGLKKRETIKKKGEEVNDVFGK